MIKTDLPNILKNNFTFFKMKDNSSREFVQLFGVLILAWLNIYIIKGYSHLLFPAFLVFFIKSKRNYFWLIFLLILIEQPGGLFSGGERGDQFRLPLYTIMPGISFSFEQLFIIAALLKSWSLRRQNRPFPFLDKPIKSLSYYFVFLLVVTLVLGTSFNGIRSIYKILINLSLYFSLFSLLQEEQDYIKFFKLLFPFAFIAFFLQFYDISTGHQLIHIFKNDVVSVQGVLKKSKDIAQRPIEMPELLFLTFWGSLYFLTSKNYFNKSYLLLVNIVSFLSIFITATRGWIIAFSASYLLYMYIIPREFLNLTFRYALVVILIIIILFSYSILKDQYFSAMERISTIELLIRGDITAGGTLKRFDVRAPTVMKAFYASTIVFGAGYSDFYFEHADGHVGYQNILLNTGIIGALIFIFFFYGLLRKPFQIANQLGSENPYKNSLKLFPIAMFAFLVLNASTQFIGYDITQPRLMIFVVVIYFLDNQVQQATTAD